MARPTKLNPQVQEAICESLRTGMTRTGAAGLARITYRTFANWYESGEAIQALLDEDPKAKLTAADRRSFEFFAAVNEAESQAEYDFTAIIYNEAQRDASHAWRWLERRRKQDYNPAPQVVQHSGPDGGPIETRDVSLSDDERVARLTALLDSARARRDGQAAGDGGGQPAASSAGATD